MKRLNWLLVSLFSSIVYIILSLGVFMLGLNFNIDFVLIILLALVNTIIVLIILKNENILTRFCSLVLCIFLFYIIYKSGFFINNKFFNPGMGTFNGLILIFLYPTTSIIFYIVFHLFKFISFVLGKI